MVTNLLDLPISELECVADVCKDSFKHFCWMMLEEKFFDPVFHGKLCDFIQYSKAQDIAIIMARVHLKTTIAATMYPLWRGVKNPNVRCLITTNTHSNACATVGEIRQIVERNQFFQALFPEVIPNFGKVTWNNEKACLNRTGTYPEMTFEAAGVGTQVTRRHYNIIIEDDLISPRKDNMTGEEMLPTREDVEKALGFHKLTIPLLIDFETDRRVTIGTRWMEDDVLQHIMEKETLENGGRYEVLDIPAIDPVTGKNMYKKFSLKALDQIRRALGPYMFNALYLNNPIASQYMKFRPQWMRYFETDKDGKLFRYNTLNGERGDEIEVDEGFVTTTVDPADPPTGNTTQDFTAILTALNCSGGLFVLGYDRGRYTEAEVIRKSFEQAEHYKSDRIRMEKDKYAHMEAGFKVECAKRGSQRFVEGVKTRGRRKEARILRLSPLAEDGLLWLRPGMTELEDELYRFPKGRHDDLIDALAWQVLDDFITPTYRVQDQGEKTFKRGNIFSFDQIMKSTQRNKSRLPYGREYSNVTVSS